MAADDHYTCEVNKGDLNMRNLADTLNDRYRDGWRLFHLLEQGGNTVMIFERRG
jgi:hypothetical protein